jgi:transcription elongation factor Elf1
LKLISQISLRKGKGKRVKKLRISTSKKQAALSTVFNSVACRIMHETNYIYNEVIKLTAKLVCSCGMAGERGQITVTSGTI